MKTPISSVKPSGSWCLPATPSERAGDLDGELTLCKSRLASSLTSLTVTHMGPLASSLHESGCEPTGAICSVTPWAVTAAASAESKINACFILTLLGEARTGVELWTR